MSAILTVFRKEMVDHLRDRRSILVAMIYPLMGPLLLWLMFNFVGGSMRVNEGAALVVAVVHAHNAPELVNFLETQGATVVPLSGDARSYVMGGWAPFALILPEQRRDISQGAVPVQLITNPSRFDSIVATGRVVELLNVYQRDTVRERLHAAGMSSQMLNVLDVEQENVGRAAGPA